MNGSVIDVMMSNGRLAGRIRRNETVCFDGRVRVDYDAFMGGNHQGRYTDLEEATRELKMAAEHASFSWHLALCESGQPHSDVCPCR